MSRLKKKGPVRDTLTGYDFRKDAALTPRRAMRLKCLECQCGNSAEVRRCPIVDCSLWPYRTGKGINTDANGDPAKTRSTKASKTPDGEEKKAA